jgi:hypothetical protein
MTARIYLVSDVEGNGRLVRAINRQHALAYVSKLTFSAKLATQDELIEYVSAGVPVQDATAAEQEAAE